MIKRLSATYVIRAVLIALLITLPFAAAFFRAYEPQATPS
jgi:hypothetical protein